MRRVLAYTYFDEILDEGAFAPLDPTRSYWPVFKAFITYFRASGNEAYKSQALHNHW